MFHNTARRASRGRAQHALAPEWRDAVEQLDACDVVWVDETGWFESNERGWMWVALGDDDTEVTVFRIADSIVAHRTGQTLLALARPGWTVSTMPELSSLIVEIFSLRGGPTADSRAEQFERSEELQDYSLEELVEMALEQVQNVETFQEVEIVRNPGIWLDLPWDIGTSLFPHLFEEGECDDGIGYCAGGPDCAGCASMRCRPRLFTSVRPGAEG